MIAMIRAFCLATALIACACSSLPPARPAVDVKALAGKWDGHSTFTRTGLTWAGSYVFQEDGRYEHSASGWGHFAGKVTVVDGKFRFMNESRRIGGTFTLHEGGGQRVLLLATDDGIIGEYRPAK